MFFFSSFLYLIQYALCVIDMYFHTNVFFPRRKPSFLFWVDMNFSIKHCEKKWGSFLFSEQEQMRLKDYIDNGKYFMSLESKIHFQTTLTEWLTLPIYSIKCTNVTCSLILFIISKLPISSIVPIYNVYTARLFSFLCRS